MVSVVRCWKAEYQKCKHSILLYMHSMIPIICAAIFAGYYHISRWELATKISAYLEVLAVAFPFLIGIIVGLVVQIENQAGHYQLLLGTIPSRMATYIGKLGFLMICAFGATFLALGTFAALYRDAPASQQMKQVEVYTDGACSGNPGPGGWGAVLRYRFNGKVYEKELSGGDASTTNNRMELTAFIEALRQLKEPCVVRLCSDSQYVINGLEMGWARGWKRRGWKKSDGSPALNPDKGCSGGQTLP